MSREIQAPSEPGHLLSWSFIAALVGLLVAALAFGVAPSPLKQGAGTVLLGLYLVAWGLAFLGAYYYSHKSFFFRGLIWVCENFSSPRGRKMAFFYSALAFIFGSVAVLEGLGAF